MSRGQPKIELLILDFAGVCTPSATELITADAAPTEVVVRPEADAIVRLAHALDVTVVILSNEISKNWIPTIPLLSLVDHVVDCADNRIFKPDRRAFQRCLLLTGLSAERTLVVDDSVDNVTVAASLGMHTVLFETASAAKSWEAVRHAMS